MIHHISLAVKNAPHVSNVLAEIIGGQVIAAPPNFPAEARFVLTGDEHGTLIEVLPYGTEMRPDQGEAGFHTDREPNSPFVATHAYLSVPISREQIEKIGAREDWMTRYCNRGPFDLMECWVENRLLLELATPEMTRGYLNFLTNPEAIKGAIAQMNEERTAH